MRERAPSKERTEEKESERKRQVSQNVLVPGRMCSQTSLAAALRPSVKEPSFWPKTLEALSGRNNRVFWFDRRSCQTRSVTGREAQQGY